MNLHDLTSFCRRHGIPETTFGRKAANDPRLIGDMRNYGRTLRPKMAERVRAFMEGYRA